MTFQFMKCFIGMFYFWNAGETCIAHWTIYEAEMLNVNVSSMLEVTDSECSISTYKKKNLCVLSYLNKMWNSKHSGIVLFIIVA